MERPPFVDLVFSQVEVLRAALDHQPSTERALSRDQVTDIRVTGVSDDHSASRESSEKRDGVNRHLLCLHAAPLGYYARILTTSCRQAVLVLRGDELVLRVNQAQSIE